ncbi:hypothetical protein ACFLTH_04510 [Bacteroidota bacterium]
MSGTKMKKPVSLYILLFLLFFQAISGFAGGFGMISNPSGSAMQLPISLLENSPFKNFLIPGIILLILLSIFPAITFYGIIKQPDWRWSEHINIYDDKHWSWTWSLYIGITLIIWITVQSALIGGGHVLQTIYDFVGILLVIFTLIPSVQKYSQK